MSSTMGELLKHTAADGFGFFPAYPGLLLNGDDTKSSDYLVSDSSHPPYWSQTFIHGCYRSKPTRYPAVKFLTAYCTSLNRAGRLNELGILEAVSPVDKNDNLPFLIDHFEELGPAWSSWPASVLCRSPVDHRPRQLQTVCPEEAAPTAYCQDNSALLGSFSPQFSRCSLPVSPVLDIKPDNILFDIGEDTDSTEKELAADPPNIDGQMELNGTTYPVMLPQPLAHDWK
ncbi:hypothetical protein EW146_g6468 [Bondarzewia mesenterica]|uniref:Protein kinase domain-containing protein n=1 Tax=Bondarzewia mesenterica TaxID=1095465 RepID=A0A4S4LNN1_9AGAM|nr:hypothetical protein EW146_g6468 [Bondarzewia mesenterica]